jgi:hypothetical protein
MTSFTLKLVVAQGTLNTHVDTHPRGRTPTQSYNHVDVYFMGFTHVVGLTSTGVPMGYTEAGYMKGILVQGAVHSS